MTIIISNNDRAQALYETLIDQLVDDPSGYALLVVQHVVPNSIPFFKALRSRFEIVGIVPKRRSTNPATLSQLEDSDPPFPILNCTRTQLCDSDYLRSRVQSKLNGKRLIILDIGGYFADSIEVLKEVFGDQIAGIVEDTENGHQKYDQYLEPLKQQGGRLPFPIFSVARSPLKEPEDYLVGQSVLYSAENILRGHNTLLTNKIVLVIGYGKIGKSIASSLAVRNVTVWVYDQDPIRCAQALAHGFHVPDREYGVENADLIVGASGNKSLKESDFYRLKHYSFVCSVTSADDEFNFGNIRDDMPYRSTNAAGEIFYNGDKKIFHLLNEGNAINFLHGAVLGTYIYLVACELIGCTAKIIKVGNDFRSDRISTLNSPERQTLANAWVEEFKNGNA